MILPSGHITLTLLSIICLQVILPLTTWQPLGWACPDCQWRLSAHLCPMQTVHPVIWKYINYSVLAISIFCNVRLTSRSKWCQTVQRYLPGARWPLVLETFQLEKARPLAGAPRPCSPNCTLPCSFQIDISTFYNHLSDHLVPKQRASPAQATERGTSGTVMSSCSLWNFLFFQ